MLKKIILENWKSFRQATLYIDPLTILIGTNASGKSNAIEALEFLQRITQGKKIETALLGDNTLPAIRGGSEWYAFRGETKFTLKVLVQGKDEYTDYFYSITVETKPQVRLFAESLIQIETSPSSQNVQQFPIFQTDELQPRKPVLGQLLISSLFSGIVRNCRN